MKAILPILICSAISAALGYYFGHITLPANSENSAPAAVTSAPVVAPIQMIEPVLPAPEAIIEDPDPQIVEAPAAPAPRSSFAERAALTIQTLTDTQGREIKASIVKVLEQDVKIRRSDGLETMIPLSMLSPEDIAFCNYLREQAKEKEAAAPAPVKTDGFDWDAYFNS